MGPAAPRGGPGETSLPEDSPISAGSTLIVVKHAEKNDRRKQTTVWQDLQRRRQAHERGQVNDDDRVGCHQDPSSSSSSFPPPRSSPPPPLPRRPQYSSTPLNPTLALLFGQFVALVATSQNAASFTLEYGLGGTFPMFLMLPTYLCLSIHLCKCVRNEHNDIDTHTTKHRHSSSSSSSSLSSLQEDTMSYKFGPLRLRTPWWYYLCLSVLDLGPNYLTLQAMQRTTLTSATLLGSLTIPSTMLFCGLLLKKTYRPWHYAGVVLVMVGGTLTILTDRTSASTGDDNGNALSVEDEQQQQHPHSYVGDIFAVLAALGYGVGDAGAEFWSKHVDRREYLGMIGLFGSLWTLLIFPVLEWNAITQFFFHSTWDKLTPALGVIAWYVVSLVAYYIAESSFLVRSDATLLNLSLQSSQFYAILFSVLAFHERPPPQFFVAVSCVVAGVFVYELCGNATRMTTTKAPDASQSLEQSPILNRSVPRSPQQQNSDDYESIETTSLVQTSLA